MTDITELAQSLKNAASKALIEEGLTWFSEEQLSHEDGIDLHKADAEFISLANPANVLALVEAVEKAQGMETYWKTQCRGITDHCEELQARIAELESRTVTDWIEHDGKWRPESLGLDELVYLKTRKQELKIPYPAGKVKGWMNTGGDMDVMAYKLASPQASTVTVKLPQRHSMLLREDFNEDYHTEMAYKADEVHASLAAAGIKVEAE